MQPALAPDMSDARFDSPVVFSTTRGLHDASSQQGSGAAHGAAGADLPAGADPDLLLHAIQRREQRSFALKLTAMLAGFFLAAYLAGSGNAAILQGVIHLAVGAVAGAGGLLAFQRRRLRS